MLPDAVRAIRLLPKERLRGVAKVAPSEAIPDCRQSQSSQRSLWTPPVPHFCGRLYSICQPLSGAVLPTSVASAVHAARPALFAELPQPPFAKCLQSSTILDSKNGQT